MKEEEQGGGGKERRQHEESSSSSLTAAVDTINSLISSSFSTSLFPLKWQLIRDTLNTLHTGLAAAADGCSVDGCCDNSGFAKLLRAIMVTAHEAQLLVCRSEGKHYGGGKLLLRSDLDVLAAKLDAHVKRLEGIYASGVLAHARALVVPKPGAGASRDDMRFYVRDLFSRLKVGGTSEMRKQAMVALNEVLQEDEKYVKVVVTDVADGIGLLVSLLECQHGSGIREEALEAVSVIAGFDSYKGDLIVAGVIAPVISVLDTGTSSAKERAARALRKLTENSDNAWAVAAHGGVTALLNICSDRSSSMELVCMACRVLRSLTGVDEIKKYMVEAGAVPVFMSVSQSDDEATQIQAMEFLAAIACDDPSIQHVVLQEGVVESLVHVLDPSSPRSSKAREVALRAIDTLCFSSTSSMHQLIGAGFLNRVLFFLRSGDNAVQHSALKAAYRLCGVSEETKKAMGDAGFMPELVRILEAKSLEVREMAAEALCSMVSVQRNRRRFIQEDRNVGQILQLLRPDEDKPVTKRFLLSALMHLTDSNSGRRKIASSEHLKHLEKLAETNLVDAKKVVKKLAGNKLRSILNGIWSL